MFLTVLIASLVIVGIAVLGLGLNIFFRKNGKFPDSEVGTNPNMKKMGLTCAKQDEIKSYRELQGKTYRKGVKSIDNQRDCGFGCSCAAVDDL